MNRQEFIKILRSGHFSKIENKGEWIEEEALIYAKEIKINIFLLFIFLNTPKSENTQALIAEFKDFSSIGKDEPLRTMFYLLMNENEDLHCFEKLIKTCP
ncbi:hypothetical protein MP478_01615 [Chryseobacterium sp. WG14]|uniref:hypothetical protein n=1 Tax=Chryseobacterium TaxID=59732 RepID=UPI00211E6886|nr:MULTISPECIES: hypothetical protein [Chryseobacterium]MCQ9634263.1 hypothetical protein [Chryseobacterium sp. WG23]MCQ9638070.1 hypothetical protein [Chryseobacterium sp. WG14]